MRFPIARLLISLAASLVAASAAPLAATPGGGTPLPGWLAGTWAMENGASWADEVWTAARGGMMLGMARTGFGPDLESWESARIVRVADGRLALQVQPRGGAMVEYAQAFVSDDAIEFANAHHDFPQRIRYWREGQLLMIELSAIDGGNAVRMNYRPVQTGMRD